MILGRQLVDEIAEMTSEITLRRRWYDEN